MAGNLLLISTIYLTIIVSSAWCGRFPVKINRIDTSSNVSDVDDHNYKSDSLEEYISNFDSGDDTSYITDVQIDELQNAQEKMHQPQEIYQIDPRCPKFDGVCNGIPCASDNECSPKICCYNGCIQTCLSDSSAPIAIDWIPQDTLRQFNEFPVNSTTNTITIPGGCGVSQQQKKNLDLFMKYGHVTKCVCQNHDVVCYVRKRSPWTSYEDSDEIYDSDEK